jgi:hypothetical protein
MALEMPVEINIAIPAYGNTYHSETVKSLFALSWRLQQERIKASLSEISYADIVDARNYLVSNFFDRRTESHLLFVDTDMGFSPDLIVDMLKFGKPFTGVVSPRRGLDAETMRRGGNMRQALTYVHGKIDDASLTSGFVRTERCGAGILLLTRECIAEMVEKSPAAVDTKLFKTLPFGAPFKRFLRLFDRIETDTERLSEDFSFCRRWTDLDREIWANVSHDITHVGWQRFTGNYMDGRPRTTSSQAQGHKIVAKTTE